MTVGDAILSLVDKIVSRKRKSRKTRTFKRTTIKWREAIRQGPGVDIHMVGRVGFTACSISYIKKVCVFTGTHTITSLTVGIKHFYV